MRLRSSLILSSVWVPKHPRNLGQASGDRKFGALGCAHRVLVGPCGVQGPKWQELGRRCSGASHWGIRRWVWKQNSGPGSLGPPGSRDAKCFECGVRETQEGPIRKSGAFREPWGALLPASVYLEARAPSLLTSHWFKESRLALGSGIGAPSAPYGPGKAALPVSLYQETLELGRFLPPS